LLPLSFGKKEVNCLKKRVYGSSCCFNDIMLYL